MACNNSHPCQGPHLDQLTLVPGPLPVSLNFHTGDITCNNTSPIPTLQPHQVHHLSHCYANTMGHLSYWPTIQPHKGQYVSTHTHTKVHHLFQFPTHGASSVLILQPYHAHHLYPLMTTPGISCVPTPTHTTDHHLHYHHQGRYPVPSNTHINHAFTQVSQGYYLYQVHTNRDIIHANYAPPTGT